MDSKHGRKKSGVFTIKVAATFIVIVCVVVLGPGILNLESNQALAFKQNFCSRTAQAAFIACKNEMRDDFWIAIGNCNNLSDPDDQSACIEDAKMAREEAKEECKDQLEARLELCEDLGEDPYDPELNPAEFLNPEEITEHTANPYFPLVPGTKWVYLAKDIDGNLLERITVTVKKDEIKTIEYPAESGKEFRCTVVNDVVEEFIGDPGEENDNTKYIVIEDTDDWYIQHKVTGDVWYMGEIAQEFEQDLDEKKELVEIEGSWKAGRDSDKPGILMYADPNPDNENQNPYRQEFSLGNAEDVAEVVSRGDEPVTVDGRTFDDDVVKTRDWTPIEPDVFEFKYYAPGTGLIREENPESGEYVELVEKTDP